MILTLVTFGSDIMCWKVDCRLVFGIGLTLLNFVTCKDLVDDMLIPEDSLYFSSRHSLVLAKFESNFSIYL